MNDETITVNKKALEDLLTYAGSAHNRMRHCYSHEKDFMNRQRLEDVAAGLEMAMERLGDKGVFPVMRWHQEVA